MPCGYSTVQELFVPYLSVLARDLPERVGNRAALHQHVSAWEQHRNRLGIKANWQFATPDARVKLRKLYPTVED
jgi:hypothetical protein